MRHRICALWLAASVLLFGGAALAIPIAHLQLQSQPGDVISQGGTYDVFYNRPSDPIIDARVTRRLANGQPSQVQFSLDTAAGDRYAILAFGTDQLGIALQPGSYTMQSARLSRVRVIRASRCEPGPWWGLGSFCWWSGVGSPAAE